MGSFADGLRCPLGHVIMVHQHPPGNASSGLAPLPLSRLIPSNAQLTGKIEVVDNLAARSADMVMAVFLHEHNPADFLASPPLPFSTLADRLGTHVARHPLFSLYQALDPLPLSDPL